MFCDKRGGNQNIVEAKDNSMNSISLNRFHGIMLAKARDVPREKSL